MTPAEKESSMDRRQAEGWSRREFLEWLTLAGAAGLLGLKPEPVAAEPPPETTRIRLHRNPGICIAPQYIAEELLKAEGFTDVQYVADEAVDPYSLLAAGRIDISMAFVAPFLIQVDAGVPIVFLAGIHVGCFELFGNERVRTIRDLKGMRVGVPEIGTAHHVFIAAMAAYVGLDPQKDIHWVVHPVADSAQL